MSTRAVCIRRATVRLKRPSAASLIPAPPILVGRGSHVRRQRPSRDLGIARVEAEYSRVSRGNSDFELSQAFANRPLGQIRDAVDRELPHDAAPVGVDSAGGDEQAL